MKNWWREKDFSDVLQETGITARQNSDCIVAEIQAKVLTVGSIVTVTIDRPLGSYHPKHKDLYYPVNYGYVAGITAPDGEEQDAYVLGVQEPVQSFTGRIIAVIRRADDVEEKWVAAPEDVFFTKDEIMEQVRFQEQYFQAEIIM